MLFKKKKIKVSSFSSFQAIFIIFFVIFLTPLVFSQDRYEEFKNYSASHETILTQIYDSGTFGNIQVRKHHLFTGETYIDIKAFQYFNGLLKRDVKLVLGNATTPEIYIGSVNENLQLAVITVYREDYTQGENQVILVDNINKQIYLLAFLGNTIKKVVPFEDGMIIEQVRGYYRSPIYVDIYSYITLSDGKIISENYEREIRVF